MLPCEAAWPAEASQVGGLCNRHWTSEDHLVSGIGKQATSAKDKNPQNSINHVGCAIQRHTPSGPRGAEWFKPDPNVVESKDENVSGAGARPVLQWSRKLG